MGAPKVKKVVLPFYHSSKLEGDKVLVTHVFIQAIFYSDRFFWIHVTEGKPDSFFGPCSMSIKHCNGPASSTVLCSGGSSQISNGNGSVEKPEQVFCTSLSRRLTEKIYKEDGKQVAVISNCSVNEDNKILLLGTDAGSGTGGSIEFGALVFRECLHLFRETLCEYNKEN